MRSPACGSPETSSTRSFSRMPSIGIDGPVVVGGELARDGLRLDLDDVRAAMVDADGQAQHLARHGAALAEPARRRGGRVTRDGIGAAGILDAQADRLVLADDAEARRIEELDAPVALVRRGR